MTLNSPPPHTPEDTASSPAREWLERERQRAEAASRSFASADTPKDARPPRAPERGRDGEMTIKGVPVFGRGVWVTTSVAFVLYRTLVWGHVSWPLGAAIMVAMMFSFACALALYKAHRQQRRERSEAGS